MSFGEDVWRKLLRSGRLYVAYNMTEGQTPCHVCIACNMTVGQTPCHIVCNATKADHISLEQPHREQRQIHVLSAATLTGASLAVRFQALLCEAKGPPRAR